MNNQPSISDDIEDSTELTIDDLDAVAGGGFCDGFLDIVRAALCMGQGNCTSHATTLP